MSMISKRIKRQCGEGSLMKFFGIKFRSFESDVRRFCDIFNQLGTTFLLIFEKQRLFEYFKSKPTLFS